MTAPYNAPMRILIANDDGYLAPGLAALVKACQGLGHIDVIAPEQNASGTSNALTLSRPLSVFEARGEHVQGFRVVNGTPSDCVHVALTGLLPRPDLVLSGINNGANMGDDTIYSGTVAAATEGFLLGIPSIAISLASFSTGNFSTAARIATEIVQRFQNDKLHGTVLLNINVPDIPYDELQGMEVTRLGRRHKAEPVVKSRSPRGNTVYWVGAAGPAQDAGEGTDFLAIQRNRVSVTPLQIDLTRYGQLDAVKEWLK